MDPAWRPLFSLILVSALIIHDEWVSTPSCETQTLLPTSNLDDSESESMEDHSEDLRVMLVADLLLLGSDSEVVSELGARCAGGFGRCLGEGLGIDEIEMAIGAPPVSRRSRPVSGASSSRRFGRQGRRPLQRAEREIRQLDRREIPGARLRRLRIVRDRQRQLRVAQRLALLCGNNDLRFGVEKVLERESSDLRAESEEPDRVGEVSMVREFGWRENGISSGSGSVVLLHFPLRQTPPANSGGDSKSNLIGGRGFVGAGPYSLMQNLLANATEYIFQALKPRIVFSAHSHEFSAYAHPDGTYEVAVPAMTWNARDDPGFIVAIFRRNRRAVSIIYCTLARESQVILANLSVLVLLSSTFVLVKMHHLIRSRR
ncbi:hypothetical protein TIFTF001_013522 [Ficus carica]|uniref:Metallophosphoesterase 1 n=1 Tax=Ficus carica TaxID=3494 RepID=A0AA88D4P3_FICCA|nr:hypothetical protein TIFTF001_013522 [Ficus carica]